MTKFSSNRPVKSTLTADQCLVKLAINILKQLMHLYDAKISPKKNKIFNLCKTCRHNTCSGKLHIPYLVNSSKQFWYKPHPKRLLSFSYMCYNSYPVPNDRCLFFIYKNLLIGSTCVFNVAWKPEEKCVAD